MSKEWIVSEEDLGCDGAYLSNDEVVRCKDCVHYNGLRCYKIKGLDDLRNLGDFCSRGERREDGKTDLRKGIDEAD